MRSIAAPDVWGGQGRAGPENMRSIAAPDVTWHSAWQSAWHELMSDLFNILFWFYRIIYFWMQNKQALRKFSEAAQVKFWIWKILRNIHRFLKCCCLSRQPTLQKLKILLKSVLETGHVHSCSVNWFCVEMYCKLVLCTASCKQTKPHCGLLSCHFCT